MADSANEVNVEVQKNLKVGFIGGGNMARAIAEGLISSGAVSAANITASATTQRTLDVWEVGRNATSPLCPAYAIDHRKTINRNQSMINP